MGLLSTGLDVIFGGYTSSGEIFGIPARTRKMDVVTASEIDRRAWAVEQAVKMLGAAPTFPVRMPPGAETDAPAVMLHVADRLLAYVDAPVTEADARLLDAARAYDGSQDAGNLIGLLADALERR